ncbi:sulfurtransferase [Aphanothece hegewaldii CCALA 016]|uniref:Sulfurtransferase n=1 Tax=Aphanothece hegewaldii CCALA 016 TaxID=2107694 RepID=A0A2T1LYX0_9CHRO|nr:sulfurtransferase [Aphanothece hegewaldii]PSF37529.1 sulfurtransferase [Aphanothece hegewaldii CCALA 016]
MNDFSPIVSSQWLAQQLDNPSVIIIDCRFQLADPNWGYQQYLTNHIQGAYFLDLNRDLSAPVAKHGGRHPLPNPEQLAAKLGSIGIKSGETWVIAYDENRSCFAARLWWLLRYLGHERVSILDGGFLGWITAGNPISNDLPTPIPTQFIPQIQSDWIVDYDTVKALKDKPSAILVDSREGDRYSGIREPIDPIAGHIQGAVNSPWNQVIDESGYFHPIEDQQRLWDNYQTTEEMIIYCGSGVTACVNIFSLTLTRRQNIKLYPGGWSDWCSYLLASS